MASSVIQEQRLKEAHRGYLDAPTVQMQEEPMERIVSIEAVEGVDIPVQHAGPNAGFGNLLGVLGGGGGYDGYKVVTDEQEIFVLIDNMQSCCEHWGYLASEDDFARFIGAELRGVAIVDEALNTKTAVDFYEGGAIFVNFETSEGVLQLVAYNEHNGYYGHSVIVASQQTGVITTGV